MARLGWFIVVLAASITAGAQSRDRTPVVAPKQEIAGEAQTTATRELPRIGDTWTYRLAQQPHDVYQRWDNSYVVKVKASSSTSVVDVVSRDGAAPTEWTHTPGRHMVEQVVSVFSPYLVVFEDLKPGDRIWYATQHEDSCFTWLHCWTSGRVEGRETLQLPAGTFDTIKVTIDQNVQRRLIGTGHGGSITTRTLTIWYSPQAKRAVKVTSRKSLGVRTPFFAPFDLELVSYQLDRTQVVAPKEPVSSEPRHGLALGSRADIQGAQTSATKGLPRVGDTWAYVLTERRLGGIPSSYQISDYVVKAKAISGTNILDEVSRDGAAPVEVTHSPGRHMVEQVVSVFSPYLVVFEDLNPGDRILHASQHDDICFSWLYCWTSGRVEGRETLELAAGTFDTIKVTIEQNVQTRSLHSGAGGPISTRTLTIWYSPQAKRAVKVTSRLSGGIRTQLFASYDLILVSYRLQ